ncbi:MAG: polysaccharide deacetylase family protein [Bacteroidota bacterium]
MYLIKTPQFIQQLFPNYLWRIPTQEKLLYLSFDDGPIPEVTPWVLDTLRAYRAKATFFCVGDNICKHPDIFERLQQEKHSVGNHTFHHLDGWKTSTSNYLYDVEHCSDFTEQSTLFRPPYGHLKFSQVRQLRNKYRIVLWDVLSGDFDANLAPEKCLKNVLSATQAGSIIVFHDSLKAAPRLKYVLPKFLEHYHQRGFQFKAITNQ